MAHSKSYGFKTYAPRLKGQTLIALATTYADQSEIHAAAQTAPDNTPLAILTRSIIDAGYLPNMTLIASGRNIGRVTPALASAIVCESKGTHKRWHVCNCDREEIQRHAARLLQSAFGITAVVA